MTAALRALNGFGLGARPGERLRIGDPRRWLRAQLDGGAPTLPVPDASAPSRVTAMLSAYRGAANGDRQARQQLRQGLVAIAAADGLAALGARVASDRPFVERLVAFWSNHLCVSSGSKLLVAPLAGSYEREAIRPFVLGRFHDMVRASARHPAMLLYLDNAQSIGPSSAGARLARGRVQRGLNENYARELLELHTLGVDGGYEQPDVQALARILTGWTIAGLNGRADMAMDRRSARAAGTPAPPQPAAARIDFVFRPFLHEPGDKVLLGERYRARGVEEGEEAIRALCRHPSTARLVARKLVAHFVSDTPPPDAVNRLARVFLETDGDLRAVSAALIDLPEAWGSDARKFRTPQDWLVAVLRATGATEAAARHLVLLRQLRHPLWSPQAPKGFGDTTQEWADPESLLNRAELARTIARRLARATPDPLDVLDVVDVAADDPLRQIAADRAIRLDERLALVLASPAFQWR